MANDQKQQPPRPQQPTPAGGAPAPTAVGMPADIPTRTGWEEQVQEFLWGKGWRPSGYSHDDQVLWEDPQGSNAPPERKYSHSLKDEGGNEVKVMQTFAPPIPWSHKTADAYAIQRARDQWAADAPKREAEAVAKEDRRVQFQRELAARRARRAGVGV